MPCVVPIMHAHLPTQTMSRIYSKSQIICFYCTGVCLDLCRYHCQSYMICVVYIHKHPVLSYSSSKLLHNKTDNSLYSLCRKVPSGSGYSAASALFSRKSRYKTMWVAQYDKILLLFFTCTRTIQSTLHLEFFCLPIVAHSPSNITIRISFVDFLSWTIPPFPFFCLPLPCVVFRTTAFSLMVHWNIVF